MEKQKKVLDASVIVKLFVNEEYSEKSLNLINDYEAEKIEIVVPDFLYVEVINALRYKKKDERELKKAAQHLFNLELKTEKISYELLSKSIFLSLKYNLTVYDSLYLSLAQFNGCSLITADKELHKIPNVVKLEECA